jgi:hypothetical protein
MMSVWLVLLPRGLMIVFAAILVFMQDLRYGVVSVYVLFIYRLSSLIL